ncbi:MAG: transketolase C-terminal domain-containing protein [Spirochaetales bacterium]|uniref:Transketolase C-terminal domain-containing protein n=1 Tax=Candidatus Thalassospirochaeta sargassi TaxID=3119039 RepID=A0AAJ1IER7_9SPIO|nr:transketolase C-terminal domain-containing protein [Spirochaetales bacterium]
MSNIPLDKLQDWSKQGHRTVMGDSLVMLAAEKPEMVTVTADLTPTARLVDFQEKYPDRFFDVGIAEQNLIDFSAGLAVEGLIPYAVDMAAIVPMRPAEQMRMALGYMNLNAKVISIEAGVRFGPLGNTHYGMDDIAVTRAIPNFTVMSPSDPLSIYKTIFAIAEHDGPVYVRLTGGPGFPIMYPEDFDFQIGKAVEYKEGSQVALISTGSMLGPAAEAAGTLEAKGISTRVVDMHTIKPLDTDMLDKVFAENRLIVTVEEHNCIGGLGSAVAEYKAGVEGAPRQVMASLGDEFKKIGDYKFKLKQSGLTAEDIAALAEANL